jgi:predicted transcriptional regulator
MSPRAAWRLEQQLGFTRSYDFVGGKAAWIARGLPTEGTGPFLLLAGQVLRPAAVTCRPDTPAGRVRAELQGGRDSICAVINEHSIVLGRVRWKDLPDADDVPVERFMQLGPATVQPREELSALVQRMGRAGVKTILVTTEKGVLLGVAHRDDGERLVAERASRERRAEAVE